MALKCLNCGAEFESERAICQKCFDERQKAPKPEDVYLPKHEPLTLQDMLRDTRVFAVCVVLVVAGAIGAFFYFSSQYISAYLPKVALPTTAAFQSYDPCEHKDACLVVYLNPQNNQELQMVRELGAGMVPLQKVGFQVVIANATPELMSAAASSIGGGLFIDNSEDFLKKTSPGATPYWWLISPERRVLSRFSALPSGAGSVQENLSKFVDDNLSSFSEYFR